MTQPVGSVVGLVAAVLASAALGAPFLLTGTGRRAVAGLTGPDGDDPLVPAGVYLGLAMAYGGVVVLAGESANGTGALGLTLTLLLPFAFGVAAATTWLPSVGVEWRPSGEARVDATLTFAGFLATLTASSAGGWLLLG
ncbi:hypothetical protein [Halobaculum lipolyticum]|uniref:DUF1761 domain-containing protein n=1 Tax=Halobaculum lipolyticum TaxID=3032001 RepID=A0ABD5W8U6_9EURY|nr:hypothetical protein [Halobaculum sp. DT31]